MFAQVKNLEWAAVPDRSLRRRAAHDRWELRSMRTLELADGLTPFHLPHAATAIHLIRAAKGKTSHETVYYTTDLRIGPDLTPAALAFAIRRHWAIENSSHHIRDRSFAEDAHTTGTGTTPQAFAALCNLAIGLLHCTGETNIAQALRRNNRNEPATLEITLNQI